MWLLHVPQLPPSTVTAGWSNFPSYGDQKVRDPKNKTEPIWPHEALLQIPHDVTGPLFIDETHLW